MIHPVQLILAQFKFRNWCTFKYHYHNKNTAVGTDALKNHTEGSESVALGYVALEQYHGQWNIAVEGLF